MLNLRLRHLLTVLFVVVATMPAIFLGGWVQVTTMQKEIDSVSEKHLLIARNITAAFDRYANDSQAAFAFFTETALHQQHPAGMSEFALNLGFRCFMIVDQTGKSLFFLPGSEQQAEKSLPEKLLKQLPQSTQNPLGQFSEVMADAMGNPALYLMRQLDAERFAVGVLSMDYLVKMQDAVKFGRKGHAAIVDQKGQVLAHPNKNWTQEMKNISKVEPVARMIAGETGISHFYSPAVKKDMISGFTTVPRTGWGVMVPQPIEELEERANSVRLQVIAIIGIGLVVAGLLSWWVSGLLTRPLNSFNEAAHDFGQKKWDTRVSMKERVLPVEFQELGHTFNGMAQQLQIDQERQLELDRLKDDFLANTSHELRTPLHGIIGLGESLLEGTNGPITSEQAKTLQLIIQSGRRLTHLINDIQDYSKIKHHELPLKLDSVDIRVATDLVFMLSKGLIGEKPIRLHNHIPKDAPLVIADEDRLQQILMNLVGNAIKFTYEGEINLTSQLEKGFLRISVIDSGIGIPEEKQEGIFHSFEQVDSSMAREFGGTGLGLSIARQLVEMHGGTLEMTSEAGQGSTFSFLLPLAQDQNRKDPISLSPVSVLKPESPDFEPSEEEPVSVEKLALNLDFSAAKVLIVDDEYMNIQVLKNQLSGVQYQVLVAQDGFQALEIVEKEKPDLILLDLMMPRMNGYDVCAQIRKKYDSSTMPVIIVTAKNQLSDLVQGFETGANDYMTKPLQKRELLSRIQSHLQIREMTKKMLENVRLQIEVEERKKNEETLQKVNKELKDTQSQLIQAGKLAAIGELATGVAHELNQPLFYIRTHSQMILEDGPEKLAWESVEKTLRIIESGTERMMKIINHLQNFSYQSSQEFIPVQLEEVLENSLLLLNEQLKDSNIHPEKQYAANLPNVMGDSVQLEQVLINIIRNAKDALTDQENPHITLITELRQQDNLSRVVVTVRDNGPGMSPELIENIFNPFFTTKELGKGTGLGLSISHGIIQNHQGEILVTSEPGKGSSFEIHFPIKSVS